MRGSWDLGSHLADTEAILSIVEAKKMSIKFRLSINDGISNSQNLSAWCVSFH
jgi:hypothetical protein